MNSNATNKELTETKSIETNIASDIVPIENRILTFRGQQVMIDRDIAELYGVETKRLNEQVKRNIERFPERFRFQLTKSEKEQPVAICDRFKSLKHSSVFPYAFTEQGVFMLSAVLKSLIAVNGSIRIIDAFVSMRKFFLNNAQIFQRLKNVELKQIETVRKIDKIFDNRQNRLSYRGIIEGFRQKKVCFCGIECR